MNAYSISKLADDACVSVHVVRDYMIRGLLHPARRTESGYNIFDDKTLGRLRFLRAAFESGIGLDRAGTHAGSSQAGPAVCKGSYRHRARPGAGIPVDESGRSVGRTDSSKSRCRLCSSNEARTVTASPAAGRGMATPARHKVIRLC